MDEEKTYTLVWDETVRYIATVKAIDKDHAKEVWDTGIEGQFVEWHIAQPSITEEI